MKPFLEKDFYYYGMSFHPVQLLIENDEIINWWGPSWYVTYDAQTLMTQPLEVRVNLLGQITATNPNNLIEEIIPRFLERKMQIPMVTNGKNN